MSGDRIYRLPPARPVMDDRLFSARSNPNRRSAFGSAVAAVVASQRFAGWSRRKKNTSGWRPSDDMDDDLCFGDVVTLYSEDTRGFVFSSQSSSVHNEIGIAQKQDDKNPEKLPCLQAIQFEICAQNRYKANKKLAKLKATLETDRSVKAQVFQAKKSAQAETSDNSMEQKRQRGKPLYYGQIVQLRHVFTDKYIHVNTTQTSWTETSNLLAQLITDNSKKAQFKVIPRYKVKSEGDMVQVGDLVVFESVKSPGRYLHCSLSTYSDSMVYHDNHELNLSVIQSGFSVLRSSKAQIQDQVSIGTVLKGGSILQLFHKEMEGYLAAEGVFGQKLTENVHLRLRPVTTNNHKSLIPPSSAINCWQVEKEKSVIDCSAISWGENIRLQHITTRQYLSMSEEKVRLTLNRYDPLTVFRFFAVAKRSERIKQKTFVRIQHVMSGSWIHGERSKPYERMDRTNSNDDDGKQLSWSRAPTFQIGVNEQMQYNDAFTVQIQGDESVKHLHYVAGMVPFLHKLLAEFHHCEEFSARLMHRIIAALTELERFMNANGVADKNRQKLLRNFQVVDLLVQILRCPSQDARSKDFVQAVHAQCYTILQVYLEGFSAKNELYLAKHIDFFREQLQNQGAVGLKAAHTLMELLKDNRSIIERISRRQIDSFIGLIFKNKNYRYLDLLSVLCIAKGLTLPDNQKYIAQRWLLDAPRNGKNVVNYLSMGDHIGLDKGVCYVSTDMKNHWEPLIEFVNQKGTITKKDYNFMEYQLRLFSSLCRGRNTDAIDLLKSERLMTYQIAFHCMQNEAFPAEFRSVCGAIIRDLFVDIGTNYSLMDRVKLVFDYDAMVKPGQQRKNRDSSVLSGCVALPFAKPLKQWISWFLDQNKSMVASNVARNHFIKEVLNLVHSLVDFGYYGDTEEVQKLLKPMFSLMDGRNDTPYDIRDPNVISSDIQEEVNRFREDKRFKENPQNNAITEAKLQAMKVIELFFNFRFNTRLTRFIEEFKSVAENPDTDILGPFLLEQDDEEEFRSNQSMHKVAIKELTDMFRETSYFGEEFVDILKDLLKYSQKEIVTESLLLLEDYFTANEDLFSRCIDTQLLLTEKSRHNFQKISQYLPQLKILKKTMNEENVEKLMEVLQDFIKMCCLESDLRENHPLNQEMLYNAGILSDMFDMMAPFSSKLVSATNFSAPDDKYNTQLLKQCFRFLKAFARGNFNIQERLFDRLDFLNSIQGAEAELGEVFIEIFNQTPANNCLRVQPAFIQDIVRRYSENFHPVWLSVLSTMVVADILPIKRNQNIVVRALMTYQQSLEIITATDAGTKLRILKGDASAASQARSGKHQLCSLVYLFSICAYGDNKSIESICQCLLTMDELLRFINMQSLCCGLRLPFVNFLTTGYMNSYSDAARSEIEKHGKDQRWVTFFKSTVATLLEGVRIVQEDVRNAKELLRCRPSNLHRSKTDEAHEKKETLHYIFDGVLPFFRAIFEKHWGHTIPENRDLGNDVLKSMLAFAHAVHPALMKAHHRTLLVNTIKLSGQTMNINVTIPGELNIRIDTSSDARSKYDSYYRSELELNKKFDLFTENLQISYEGENSVEQQIGFPSDAEYANQGTEEYLPLGAEFQLMVKCFATTGKGKKEQKYDIAGLVKHLSWSMRMQETKEKRRLEIQRLDVKCLQILRTMIHNEFVRLPTSKKENPQLYRRVVKEVEKVQNSLDEQGLIQAVMPHLGRNDDKVVRECFNLLNMLYKSNKTTPDTFVKYIEEQRSEAFFVAVQTRLQSVAGLIKEKRFMLTLHQRVLKENEHLLRLKPASRHSRNPSRARSGLTSGRGSPLKVAQTTNRIKNLFMSKVTPDYGRRDRPIELLQLPDNEEEEAVRPDSKEGKLADADADDMPLIVPNPPPRKATRANQKMSMANGTAISAGEEEGDLGDSPASLEIYHDFRVVRVILRTLNSLCDLEFAVAQHLMREQPKNVKSVNLVAELCHFLSLLYANIDSEYIDLVTELLETLIECIQGNTANQAVMFDSKVIDYINHMLRNNEYPGCNLDQVLRFKGAVGTTIRFLTEENQLGHSLQRPCQSRMIMSACNTEGVWQTVLECHKFVNHEAIDRDQKETANSIGFLFFSLLLRGADLGLYSNKELQKQPAWAHFTHGAMSVEILKADQLQRLYFRVLDQSVLRESVQDRLKWEVDRSSQGNKMRDFMAWSKDMHNDIQYQRRIHQNVIGRFLVKNWKFLNYISLALTLILNFLVIATWTSGHRRNGWVYHEDRYDVVWRVCAGLHNACAVFLVSSYFLSNLSGFASSARSYMRWFKKLRLLTNKKESSDRSSKLEVSLFGILNIYYLTFLAFSILGTIETPAFFAFHLLQIITNNQLLMRVIRAVTLNGRSLLWVVVMGIIIIYFYGLIGFMNLRNVFLGNLHFCDDVWECTLTMFREGLMYRAMRLDYPVRSDPSRMPDNADFSFYATKLFFDISFFAIVLTIGLNVIFGIIVDTFRQLRDDKWRVEQDVQAHCFICGRNSYEFEQRGISFKYHCNDEHGIFAYVFFFVRLQDMPIEDLSHLEMYSIQQVNKENFNFFPMNRALSLVNDDDEKDEENDEVMAQLDIVINKLNEESAFRTREMERLRQAEWQLKNREINKKPERRTASIGEIDVAYESPTGRRRPSSSPPRRRRRIPPIDSPEELPFRPVSKHGRRR